MCVCVCVCIKGLTRAIDVGVVRFDIEPTGVGVVNAP